MTAAVPKELLPVGVRPLLQWCLTEALEAGFLEIAVVVREGKEALSRYVEEGAWRDGLHEAVREAAEAAEVSVVTQARPAGVVDAILSARKWIREGSPFAVYLPDNVRIAGPPLLSAAHLAAAAAADTVLVACHRVGPETRRFFGDAGRATLDELAPAGAHPAVRELQPRGRGVFRASPEGAWRLAPRYTVTAPWLRIAGDVAGRAAMAGVEADDVTVHRRLADDGRLRAVPWRGTLVDAGHPAGWLYAQHLLHEAAARAAEEEEEAGGGLLEIETRSREASSWKP